MKDTLFLLEKDFTDGDSGPFYCPESALNEGVLSYYPQLREQLDIRYVGFAKPRFPLVELLGEANQGCPVLVIGDDVKVGGLSMQTANGHRFISGEHAIARYLAQHCGIGSVHGDDVCAIAGG